MGINVIFAAYLVTFANQAQRDCGDHALNSAYFLPDWLFFLMLIAAGFIYLEIKVLRSKITIPLSRLYSPWLHIVLALAGLALCLVEAGSLFFADWCG